MVRMGHALSGGELGAERQRTSWIWQGTRPSIHSTPCVGSRIPTDGGGSMTDVSRRQTLQEQFGEIDIYLFDQLLKGRITPGMRILDAGCGSGRNIHYFLREGYDVLAADADAKPVDTVRSLAGKLAPKLPASNFRVEPVERMSFDEACADVVICNTVLHFAADDAHFESMLRGCWHVLKPGGLFFSRLGSTTGMETQVEHVGGRRYKSPDKSERYLVDDALLREMTERVGGELAEPLKTTVVHNLRSMTTWVMTKRSR
jgi:2-polyprenyl-3-methyl-5-hydroxy-6-metoxy-1,4-benzoquinol methylase